MSDTSPDSKAPLYKKSKLDPQTEALVRAIREQSETDPLVGAKVGGKEILHRLMQGMKNERGIHIESLLCALGALAGYSCQANVRAQAISNGMEPNSAFQVLGTKDGKKYFFGDALNNAVAGSKYSVWSLAAGAAQHAGLKELPDINEFFKHTTAALGGPEFGVPRVPEKHVAGDTPANFLKALWPAYFPVVKLCCPNPPEWPVLFGLAIQELIGKSKSVIDPGIALRIIMESAVPMSKVDLENL